MSLSLSLIDKESFYEQYSYICTYLDYINIGVDFLYIFFISEVIVKYIKFLRECFLDSAILQICTLIKHVFKIFLKFWRAVFYVSYIHICCSVGYYIWSTLWGIRYICNPLETVNTLLCGWRFDPVVCITMHVVSMKHLENLFKCY